VTQAINVAPGRSATRAEGLRTLERPDVKAVAAILVAFALALTLMPVRRDFAYVDDWVFARTVEKIVAGQGFVQPDLGQMTLVSHAYWGALFAWLFGMSFTVLTAANMTLALVASLAFYAILRRLGFAPGLSLLGTALLVLNPFFVTLSYSFMTEISFIAFMLLSCLFYLLGFEPEHPREGRLQTGWLWLGGLFAALAFLDRQFGLALPVAALLWLFLARKASWASVIAVAALPLVAIVGYYLSVSGSGSTFSDSQSRSELLGLFTGVGGWVYRLKSLSFALPMIGLAAPIFLKVRWWFLAAPLALIAAVVVAIQGARRDESVVAGGHMAQPFDVAQPFRLEFTPFWWAAAALTVWAVFCLAERAWPGLQILVKRKRQIEPIEFFYIVGLTLLAGTFVARMEIYIRYLLPVSPFVIIAGLTQMRGLPLRRLAPTLAALLVMGAASIALHLDDYSFLQARWQAGRDLVAQGVPYTQINNGFTWDSYYLYDRALQQIGHRDVANLGLQTLPEQIIDPVYVIGVNQPAGYSTVSVYPYFSLLDGLVTHDIYVMKRNGR
jgi:hypothetical protein